MAKYPRAFVYKAFNTLGFENFQNPTFGDKRGDLWFGLSQRLVRHLAFRVVHDSIIQ